jgi:hypothetical protein
LLKESFEFILWDEKGMPNTYKSEIEFSCDVQTEFNWVIDPPVPRIVTINHSGRVLIEWNKNMSSYENTTVIHNNTVQINETSFPVLNVSVIPGDFSDPAQLNLNWTATAFYNYTLEL